MFVWVCFGEGLCAWKRGYHFCHFSPRCCLWLRFEMECHVVDGEWWRMWALTCWGHRRRGTESINGVTGSERRWADVIAMCAGGIVLQSDHADLTPDLITHWDVFEKQILWPFLLAVSVGLTCRGRPSSSKKDFASFITQTHIHAHTKGLNDYSPVNGYSAPKRPQERQRREVGKVWGRGSGRDITSPVCTVAVKSRTKKGWRVGQSEQGMEVWGGSKKED